jgi:thioredoxin reductase (NADPH)
MWSNETDNTIHDLAIVGCGPAGLSAAVNAKARNLDFSLLGSEFCSPKLYKAETVNNYLGVYDISGEKLRNHFINHIKDMEITLNRSRVDNIYPQDGYYTLMSRLETYNAYSVILAPGINFTDYLEGEENMIGNGVSYCATCDAGLYRGKKVAAISYTKESIEEVEFLADIADKVYFLPQFNHQQSLDLENIEVIKDKPTAVKKDGNTNIIISKNRELQVDGIFVFREATPPDKLIFGIELDGHHIKVNKNMETNLSGVFAAGDCTGTPYQLGRAVGQGQVAALSSASFIRTKKKKTAKQKVKKQEAIYE